MKHRAKLQDLLDEYEDAAYNRENYKIRLMRKRIEELLDQEEGGEINDTKI